MKIFSGCPGAANIKTPTLEIRECPKCGEKIEIFSDEMQAECSSCGFVIYRDLQSCVEWCEHARECIGEEAYRKLKKK